MCRRQQGEIDMFAVMNPWFCLGSAMSSVDRRMRKVLFGGTGLRLAFDPAGRFARVGVQEHCQPGDGPFIVFPLPAHVTNPGGEVRDRDQFLPKPCEIREVTDVHNSRCALIAWKGRRSRRGKRLLVGHLILHVSCEAV